MKTKLSVHDVAQHGPSMLRSETEPTYDVSLVVCENRWLSSTVARNVSLGRVSLIVKL
jgi:hypothetical protein